MSHLAKLESKHEREILQRRNSHGYSNFSIALAVLLVPVIVVVWLPLVVIGAPLVAWYWWRSPNNKPTPSRWICPIQPPDYASDFKAHKTDVVDDEQRKGHITVWTYGNLATAADVVVMMHAADDNPSVWLGQARTVVRRGDNIACVLPFLPGYEPSSSYMSSNTAVLGGLVWQAVQQVVNRPNNQPRYHFMNHGMGVCMVRALATERSAVAKLIRSWTVWAISPNCGQGLGNIVAKFPPQILASWYVPTFQIPFLSDVLYTRNHAALVKKFFVDWAPVGMECDKAQIDFARDQFCQPGVVTSVLRQYRSITMLDPLKNSIPKMFWPAGTEKALNAAFGKMAPHIARKYICGTEDGVGLYRTLQLLNIWLREQNMPEVHFIKRAGHWLMMDQPEESFEHIREQLTMGGATIK